MKYPLRFVLAVAFIAWIPACGGADDATFPPDDAGSDADSAIGADGTTPFEEAGEDATLAQDSSPGAMTDAAPNDAEGPTDSGAQDATQTADATGVDASDGGTVDGAAADGASDAPFDGADASSEDAAAPGDTGAPDDAVAPGDAAPPQDASALEDAGSPDDASASDDADTSVADASDGGAIDSGPPLEAGTIDFVSGVMVSTLAGSAVGGTQDGTGSGAQFDNPTGMAVDLAGDLIVTDYDSSRVRRVTPQGVVTTLAAAANFMQPFAAVVATDGTYYVATDYNSAPVKNATSGTLWRVVPLADGGIAMPTVVASGTFNRPRGLAPIAGGDLFVADHLLDVVETVAVSSGAVSFVAGVQGTGGFANGSGSGAEFNLPTGAATLPDGSVVVADSSNNMIRRVDLNGAVTTFAGDGSPNVNDGPVLSAEFNAPHDVAVDAAGNVYVSDGGNHLIRRIRVDGNVDTLAGDGTAGFNDGAGPGAEFYGQEGIDVTPDGTTVYVADGNAGDGSAYHRVRAISIP